MVAVDGSDSALHALDYAINLAKNNQAKLEVIYIVPYAMGNIDAGIFPTDIEKQELEDAKTLLDSIKNDYDKVDITNIVSVGKPIDEIEQIIGNWQADLFVIGHHTHSVIDRILNGSVELGLLKHLNIPLLIIPPNYTAL